MALDPIFVALFTLVNLSITLKFKLLSRNVF